MEDASWEQKLHTLTHILTSPTTAPPLHSQFFISSQIPCYLNWDYPPLLCNKPSTKTFPSLHLQWGLSLFLKRVSRLGLPETSWRCKSPYIQPPPLILAKGMEAAQWDDERRIEYARRRLRRKPLYSKIHPALPVLVPNLVALFIVFNRPLTTEYVLENYMGFFKNK